MRTSQEWWQETKSKNLIAWLRKQYHGEFLAAERIEHYAILRCEDEHHRQTLQRIAADERRHASWVGDLLRARGEEPQILATHTMRYWDKTLDKIDSFDSACAVAAHAEAMRLERIRVIAADANAPADVREVFARILRDEVFHEAAFRNMTTEAARERARASHEEGKRAIGLITTADV